MLTKTTTGAFGQDDGQIDREKGVTDVSEKEGFVEIERVVDVL